MRADGQLGRQRARRSMSPEISNVFSNFQKIWRQKKKFFFQNKSTARWQVSKSFNSAARWLLTKRLIKEMFILREGGGGVECSPDVVAMATAFYSSSHLALSCGNDKRRTQSARSAIYQMAARGLLECQSRDRVRCAPTNRRPAQLHLMKTTFTSNLSTKNA